MIIHYSVVDSETGEIVCECCNIQNASMILYHLTFGTDGIYHIESYIERI